MKISDIMPQLKNREIPAVPRHSDIQQVITTMVRFPHTRLVYVVDENNRLCGTITVGSLLRHLFPYHYSSKVHARGILRDITAARADHIMDKATIYAAPDESVDAVLKKMAQSGVKEIAVVDEQRRILTDITAIDLLKYYKAR